MYHELTLLIYGMSWVSYDSESGVTMAELCEDAPLRPGDASLIH
jgi:hypothetical protein